MHLATFALHLRQTMQHERQLLARADSKSRDLLPTILHVPKKLPALEKKGYDEVQLKNHIGMT